MKKILFICLLMGYGSAHAGLFQGNSTGKFINPTGLSTMVTTGVGTNLFTWGSGISNSPPSSLEYTGSAFNVDQNNPFVFGSLNYYNGTIASGTGANSISLSVILDFISPVGVLENFGYNLGLINTPNSSDPNSSADIVNFDNTVPSNFFSAGGVDYTLEFLGFGTLSGGGFTISDSFRVFENDSASVDLIGRITSTPGIAVPEPSTPLLIGLGLLSFLWVRKKTNS